MSKVKCGVVRDLMPLVIDEVASEESKELVKSHVEGCDGCRGYYDGMTAGISRAAAVPDSDKSFIRLGKRMKRQVRLRKVLQWMLIAALVLVALVGGGLYVHDRMNYAWEEMPIEWAEVRLASEVNGEIVVGIEMLDGHGWHHWMGGNYQDEVFYVTPYVPALILWNQGEPGTSIEYVEGLRWEDGQMYYVVAYYDDYYNPEFDRWETELTEVKKPVRFVRWGTRDSYTTLYEEGDQPYDIEALYTGEAWTESVSMLVETPAPTATATPQPTVTPMAD